MSSAVIKFVTNRLLKDNQWNRLGMEDPYYEHVLVAQGDHPKYRKVQRRIPDGLCSKDLDVLSKFRKRAYRYDMWFSFAGVKFGWANIIGLVPILGQLVNIYWSITLLQLARTLDEGLPLDIQLIFIINVLIDFLLGLIPIVGDLIVLGYKANLRNYLVLEKHLERVGQKNLGLIEADEVRPGFINEKVQPLMEKKVLPAAAKTGESIKEFIANHAHSSATKSQGSGSDSEKDTSFASSASTGATSFTTSSSLMDGSKPTPLQR
ncbi:uncharacterized protein PRCAT00006143001 [Priceomyces carsonii]|uniref:uncharacterized protein n=1 Tax=Priceomyces carsonii TaxID=28549 RepID=UPI002ED91031|nr:unnamed protein product [Priceomyces carsonii]